MSKPISAWRQLSWLLLLACVSLRTSYAQEQQTVAQLAGKIDGELAAIVSAGASTKKQELNASLLQQLTTLREQSIMVFGTRRQQLEEKLQQLGQSCKEWQSTSSAETRHAAAERTQRLWSEMKSLYPQEALQVLPPLWTCPMHPDLMEKAAGTCPSCGMLLEPIYVTQPQLTQSPIIRAEIVAGKPLEVGKRADLRIRLVFLDNGEPVRLSDLEETHTRKIHLLISDVSETDYHHEHPEPAGDGEYAFSFTPQRPDTYRVWADLLPVRTRVQQYSVADIPSNTARQGKLADNEPENRHAEVDGYKFDLSFDKELIHERETVAGKLRVTQPDGQPCNKLGVVMGAFGHFVGFGDDFATVLHLHPVGPLITDAEARGGPELPFYFRSNKTGLFRLFAQVRINGKDFFPRFMLQVQPVERRPGL
jgi:heavy metal-binding protein